MEIDYEAAFVGYRERFAARFGDKPNGAFVKFGRAMVQRLEEAEFRKRLDEYVRYHRACKRMLESGSTISDALVLDFVESAAWVAVEAPDIHSMFRGEMGDPRVAAPSRSASLGSSSMEVTAPDLRSLQTLDQRPRRVTSIDDIVVGGAGAPDAPKKPRG